MNKPNADIELIRKYFNGELSLADQHELEKRALDDPFLQDAMDGFEAISIKQSDLNDLENRLAQRLEKKEKVIAIWSFKQWGIAASLLIGIAVISIYLNQTPENKTITISELQKKEDLPKSAKIVTDTLTNIDQNTIADLIGNNPTIVQNDVSTLAKAKEFSPAEEITLMAMNEANTDAVKDTIGLNEVKVIGYGVQTKRDISGSVSRFNAEEVAKLKTESALSGKVSGANNVRIRGKNTEQIVGKVTSSEDGMPLPGVQITNTKTGVVVSTDSNGEFKIIGEEKDKLIAKYLGFLTETIAINKNDSLKIALTADQKSLSEVVIVGYGTKKNNATEVFASPKGGWKEFRKYLDANAILDSGEKGKVIIEFIIQNDGELTDFNIQKGLSTAANYKAIQLIKNYSTWVGGKDGKPQKAKVTVRFK